MMLCNANNAGQVMTEALFSLSICLKPEDDFPHPRHLCFAYPFGKSSPKRHCIKCYCYVCEEMAPCKLWRKSPKRHCDATEKDNKWRLERKLAKKLPGSTTMVYHKLTVCARYDFPNQPNHGYSGGLIYNSNGEWVIGISMRLHAHVDPHDVSIALYVGLLESLKCAWLGGFRYLEVKLGFQFHDGFWYDFTQDAVTGKFHLCVDPYSTPAIVRLVEDYLNREWFIKVKNIESFEEEADAFVVSAMADSEEQVRKVYDFRTYPKTKELMDLAREMASCKRRQDTHHLSAEEIKYLGLN